MPGFLGPHIRGVVAKGDHALGVDEDLARYEIETRVWVGMHDFDPRQFGRDLKAVGWIVTLQGPGLLVALALLNQLSISFSMPISVIGYLLPIMARLSEGASETRRTFFSPLRAQPVYQRWHSRSK